MEKKKEEEEKKKCIIDNIENNSKPNECAVITINVNNKPIIFIDFLYLSSHENSKKIRYRIDPFSHPFFPSANHSQLATLSNISDFNTACSGPRGSFHGGKKKGKPVYGKYLSSDVINFQPTPRYSRVIRHFDTAISTRIVEEIAG